MSDKTAELILQRIAKGTSSDIDLSDSSDDDTIANPSFPAPLHGVSSEEDESGDDYGPSTSRSKSTGVSWKRHQG